MMFFKEENFWNKVAMIPFHPCWEWTGCRAKKTRDRLPYGKMGVRPRASVSAHRVSWQIHFGEIPKGKFVLHKCDNPGCVRPEHLFLGDDLSNALDRERKGRGNQPKGNNHTKAKINESMVFEIREKYKTGQHTLKSLAAEYGICFSGIHRIIVKQSWKHL